MDGVKSGIRLYDMILDPTHVEGIELYVGSAIPGQFNDSFIEIHGNQPGHARLLHCDAGELAREFHGHLVMRDKYKLHLVRHVPDDVTETPDVGVVQRGIHLVENAKRRRLDTE